MKHKSQPANGQSTIRCQHCNREAFTPAHTGALCERHLEITIFAWRVEKRGEPVTAENIRAYMARVQAPVVIRPEEVPALLADIQRAGPFAVESSGEAQP